MRPEDFAAAADTEDVWEIMGTTYHANPRYRLTPGDLAMVRLYRYARGGGMGAGYLPSQVLEEPAVMLDAFDVMAAAEQWVRQLHEEARGR